MAYSRIRRRGRSAASVIRSHTTVSLIFQAHWPTGKCTAEQGGGGWRTGGSGRGVGPRRLRSHARPGGPAEADVRPLARDCRVSSPLSSLN
jgi:hypothetical protein